tara:strand:+ start:1031 stop:1360 length:330 start_codon:yes stop_codon:yes gene_type:complete
MIPELDEKSLEEFILNSQFPVAVLFWGPWSQACRDVVPILENLRRQFARKLKFAKVNISSNKALADKHNVRGIPTIVFFNVAAKPVHSISGVYSQADFTNKFNSAMGLL